MSLKEKELEKQTKEFYDKFSELSLDFTKFLNIPGTIGNLGTKLGKMYGHNMEAILGVQKASREAPKIIGKILDDLKSGALPKPISYEDPDQTQLKQGYEAHLLNEIWASGMDMPHSYYRPEGIRYFSPFYMSLILGNYEDCMDIIGKLDKAGVEKLLRRREGYLQMSPIFMPIYGARYFMSEQFSGMSDVQFSQLPIIRELYNGRVGRMFMKVLKKLVELGAAVNSHDLGGYTPLHHCLSSQGNSYTLEMAEVLLAHGADPNAVNRFGTPPLHYCCMNQNLKFIEPLIRHNADPHQKNNDGCSPWDLSQHFPKVRQQLRRGEKKFVKKQRHEAKVNHEFKYMLSPCDEIGRKLYLSVEEQGTGKAFFYSYIKNGKHFIHPSVLPPEKW